jgi:hypothetical protein
METDSFDTVVGSNFMRSYKVKAKQIKEYETLPNDVKDFLNGVSDKLSLENKGDEK